ncbi:MAG: hypothetical protein QM765_26760 [Myxococcales bacterium]
MKTNSLAWASACCLALALTACRPAANPKARLFVTTASGLAWSEVESSTMRFVRWDRSSGRTETVGTRPLPRDCQGKVSAGDAVFWACGDAEPRLLVSEGLGRPLVDLVPAGLVIHRLLGATSSFVLVADLSGTLYRISRQDGTSSRLDLGMSGTAATWGEDILFFSGNDFWRIAPGSDAVVREGWIRWGL